MFVAIETSGDWCSVAVGDAEHHDYAGEKLGQGHSKIVLGLIDQLLEARGQHVSDAKAIIFSSGPGSFTGLRIGCGVAQGLGFGLNIPLVAVPTLEVLACRFKGQGSLKVPIVALFDARMGELYGCVFPDDVAGTNDSKVVRDFLTTPFVANADQIAHHLSQAGIEEFFAVGNAWGLGLKPLDLLAEKVIEQDINAYPRADNLLVLGIDRYKRGETVCASSAAPLYVRNNVALDSQAQQLLREQNRLAREP